MSSKLDAQVLKNIVRTLVRMALATLVGLGTSVIVARQLGPGGNGLYALATLLPVTLGTLTNGGVIYSNVFFLANGKTGLRQALPMNFILWAILSVLGVAGFFGYQEIFGEEIKDSAVALAGICSFPPYLLQLFLSSLIQGRQDFRYHSYATLAPVVLCFVFLLISYSAGYRSAAYAVACYGASMAVASVLTFYFLIKLLRAEPSEKRELDEFFTKYFRYGVFSYIGNIFALVHQRINYYFVTIFLGLTGVGVFAIATQIAERLLVLTTAVTTVALPRLASDYGESNGAQLTAQLCRLTFQLSVVAAFVLAVLAQIFLHEIFGANFAGALLPLQILLAGSAFVAVTRILANDFTARGRPQLNVSTAFIPVLVNIAACLLLIPKFGLNGAAWATFISSTANLAVKMRIFSKISDVPYWNTLWPKLEDFRMYMGLLRRFFPRGINAY
ncbi:polysaccharide biosynthesis C-terminal domain-containing protein [Novosphingobium guangzhouense]|uniref:Uncharacterized protein n=1 Tax=Novosphingobium guangzhouense TaxID=1850347 RepID=A0A2K2FZ51_9SPHN|nr:polysaccharide biosynthesis C-terminal domain-containing protein [Novosphingobium guangzhouense]PNU04066.1 hypothetical protein A8V01_05535 [Novosphingobium guangzhouense]